MKEKFDMVLQPNEEIVFVSNVNIKSFVMHNLLIMTFISLFSFAFFGIPLTLSGEVPFISYLLIILAIYLVIGLVVFVFSLLNARNTYFAITNKRIIKRSGAFNSDFTDYALTNMGSVSTNSTIFDKKGNNGSATLTINVKSFHTNMKDSEHLNIHSLNNVYEAYKYLTEVANKNNNNLRVDINK